MAALALATKTTDAMRTATGQWAPCADMKRSPTQEVAVMVAANAHDMFEIHRVLAHPSEKITQKTVQAMEIATTGQWGPCEARLQLKAKRQARCIRSTDLTRPAAMVLAMRISV